MTRCLAYWKKPCPDPAVWKEVGGCVHEHITSSMHCERHKAVEDLVCGKCNRADGHNCIVQRISSERLDASLVGAS